MIVSVTPEHDEAVEFWKNNELVATRSQHHKQGAVSFDFGEVRDGDEFGVALVSQDGSRRTWQAVPPNGDLREWATS